VEVDTVGRILVPDFLKEFAGLSTKVVLAGIHDRVEMWDENRWSEYKNVLKDRLMLWLRNLARSEFSTAWSVIWLFLTNFHSTFCFVSLINGLAKANLV
jgi:hypothetical protein